MIEIILKILAAYLLGGLMGGDVMRWLRGGADLRQSGSGNVGATNALRTRGKSFALGVLLIDIGKGVLASQYSPPPRNFSCAKTVADVPDGQLFWVIRFGSPGTAMPPHGQLSDEQVWQVVLHLRRLAK